MEQSVEVAGGPSQLVYFASGREMQPTSANSADSRSLGCDAAAGRSQSTSEGMVTHPRVGRW
jgi:hypothetical protein